MKTAIITVGLGFGDEGKGSVVDALCRHHKADLVIRYSGGSQCGHNVQVDGHCHTFSQFGAGTFARINAYLGPQVIINPSALMKEANALSQYFTNPFEFLTIDNNCLVSTLFHQNLNKIRELSRTKRHGSCGHGIGETRKYWLDYGRDAIVASDLKNLRILKDKLEILKQRTLLQISDVLCDLSIDYQQCRDIKNININKLAKIYVEQAKNFKFCDECPNYDIAIYEGAQGILLDEWYGFHPYTTWSTVTPQYAIELAVETEANPTIIGVTRTYHTRHGDGPFPTSTDQLDNLVDKNNPRNDWQGSIRNGFFDFMLYNYSINVCNHNGWKLNGIFINHVDQIVNNFWPVCLKYNTNDFEKYQLQSFGLDSQCDLTKILFNSKANITYIDELLFYEQILTNTPIIGKGFGPEYKDKKFL